MDIISPEKYSGASFSTFNRNRIKMENLKVKVTAYKGNLVINTIKPEEDKSFIPVGNGRLGCVLINTDKYLGMSKEAVELIKRLKRNHDSIGDVSTWKTVKNENCFSWFGSMNRIIDVSICECDRDGIIDIDHITIENEVPDEAKTIIDES